MGTTIWGLGAALLLGACSRSDGGQSGTDQSDVGRTASTDVPPQIDAGGSPNHSPSGSTVSNTQSVDAGREEPTSSGEAHDDSGAGVDASTATEHAEDAMSDAGSAATSPSEEPSAPLPASCNFPSAVAAYRGLTIVNSRQVPVRFTTSRQCTTQLLNFSSLDPERPGITAPDCSSSFTCSELLEDSLGCLSDCPEAEVIPLAPGESYEGTWHGVLWESRDFPSECCTGDACPAACHTPWSAKDAAVRLSLMVVNAPADSEDCESNFSCTPTSLGEQLDFDFETGAELRIEFVDDGVDPTRGFDCPEAKGLDATQTPTDGGDESIADITDATYISMNDEHTCVVRGEGRVSCWGSGARGQLGNGKLEDSAVPVDVAGLDDAWTVTVGSGISCAQRKLDTIACWGDNSAYALGNALPDPYAEYSPLSPTPTPVCGVSRAYAVSSFGSYSCAVVGNRSLSCWGQSDTEVGGLPAVPGAAEALDSAAEVGSGVNVCVLSRVGGNRVRCWGPSTGGELLEVEGLNDPSSLGANGSCAMLESGEVWCWADDTGYGFEEPILIELTDVANLAERGDCAVLRSGEVACWNCAFGLGVGAPLTCTAPQIVSGLEDANLVSGNCAVRQTGEIACWSETASGLLSVDPNLTE